MADELTRGEIRDRLTAFVARWSARAGDERKEAQQFLIELLECYGVDWPRRAAQDEDELVRLLLERNLAISRGEALYAPFPPEETPEGGVQGQLA
jgi:hypothetical protein